MLKLCTSILVFLALLSCKVVIAKEEVVYLNLGPTDLDRWMESVLKKEQKILEKSIFELPANEAKWEAISKTTITYIVTQKSIGVSEQDPCATLPIKVTLINGNFISAKYTQSGGTCLLGQSVKVKFWRENNLYITPNEIFGRIEKAKEQLKCYLPNHEKYCNRSSLKVVYSEKYGLPLNMEDQDAFTYDYFWSLEVLDLEVKS